VRGADFFLPLDWQFLATGIGLLAVLLLLPSGLGGLLADLRDGALRRVARRRGIVVPSLLADVRVDDGTGDRSLAEAVAAARAEERQRSEDLVVSMVAGTSGTSGTSGNGGIAGATGPPDDSGPPGPDGNGAAPADEGPVEVPR
jgi:hypothetical protein